MEEGTAERKASPPSPPGWRRGRLRLPERLPVRHSLLALLSIAIVLGVILGTVSTLRTGRFTAENWIDLVINGVARGSVYALIAAGYTLVYGVLFIINFAHGEVFMAGAYTALFAALALAEHGMLNANPIVSIIILLLVSTATSVIVALLLERVAYRPLRGAPRLVLLIAAIGASLFLQYTFRGLYGAQARSYPRITVLDGTWTIFGSDLARTQVVVILGALLLMVGLYLFIARARTGRSIRAVGEDKEIASLMGINVNRAIVITFAIGGLLAGVAGILYILLFSKVIFTMGFFTGIKAFTAAVLGGIGSILGAAIGGVFLGVFEAIGPDLFLTGAGVPAPNQLQPVFALATLVLVLIFRPRGILGASGESRPRRGSGL
jgi:branched-chain amino acid transport system permease protein